jgi:hypothetical protein
VIDCPIVMSRARSGRTPPIDAVRAAFEAGHNAQDVAVEWGCTPQTVRNVARRARLELPKGRRYPEHIDRPSRYEALYRPDWLAHQLAHGRTLSSIAEEVGCSVGAVRVAIAKLNLTQRRAHGEIRFPQLHDRAWLRGQYRRQGRTVVEIARLIGASEAATLRALQAARIAPRPQRKDRPSEQRLRIDWHLFPTVRTIARLHGVSQALAEVWLADIGIFTRDPAISPGAVLAEVTAGRSLRESSARLGVDPRVLRVELCRLGAGIASMTGLT